MSARGDARKRLAENLDTPSWGQALADEAEVARTRGRVLAEQRARIAELEATIVRIRTLGDAFADDGLTRHGGNIAWCIEEAIANEKGDFPDAADRRIASQRDRAEKAERERDAALAALARVEALADDLDSTVYKIPPGYPMTVNHGLTIWVREPLRAALTPPRRRPPMSDPTLTDAEREALRDAMCTTSSHQTGDHDAKGACCVASDVPFVAVERILAARRPEHAVIGLSAKEDYSPELWCFCGEVPCPTLDALAARTAPETVAPDVESVARALFAAEQCDRKQCEDVEANWLGRLDDRDRSEYRELASAVVAADRRRTVAEVKAEAVREAAVGLGLARNMMAARMWLHAVADRIERDAATSEGVEG